MPPARLRTGGGRHRRELRGTLQGARLRRVPAARRGSLGRLLQEHGHVLVRAVGCRRHVPGTAVVVAVGRKSIGKRSMCGATVVGVCFGVDEGAHDRMPERDLAFGCSDQARRLCCPERLQEAQLLGGSPDDSRVGLGRRQQQTESSRRRKAVHPVRERAAQAFVRGRQRRQLLRELDR